MQRSQLLENGKFGKFQFIMPRATLVTFGLFIYARFLWKAVIYQQQCRDSTHQWCCFCSFFSPILCAVKPHSDVITRKGRYFGAQLSFIWILSSSLVLGKCWQIEFWMPTFKTLSLLRANKSVVHLDSIYFDFFFMAANSIPILANCFIGNTTPDLGSITEKFIINICKTFLVQFIWPSSQKLKLQCLQHLSTWSTATQGHYL